MERDPGTMAARRGAWPAQEFHEMMSEGSWSQHPRLPLLGGPPAYSPPGSTHPCLDHLLIHFVLQE